MHVQYVWPETTDTILEHKHWGHCSDCCFVTFVLLIYPKYISFRTLKSQPKQKVAGPALPTPQFLLA